MRSLRYWEERAEGVQEIKKFAEYIKAEQKNGLISIGWSSTDFKKGWHPKNLDDLINYLESGFTWYKARLCRDHNIFNEAIKKGKITEVSGVTFNP